MSHPAIRRLVLAASLFFGALTARADDLYQVIQVSGDVGGFAHSSTRQLTENGVVLFETTSASTLRLSRMDVPIEIESGQTVVEDEKGKIVRIKSRLKFAKNDQLFEGVVIDDELKYTAKTTGTPRELTIDFSDDIPGPLEKNRRMVATGFKAGAKTTFCIFDFSYGEPIEADFTCEATEEVELLSGKKRLHRFKVVPKTPAIPPSTLWVDDSGETRRESTAMIGMEIATIDATKAQWQEASGTKGAEMFVQSMIDSNVKLKNRHELKELHYRLSMKDPKAEVVLPEDAQQGWIEQDDERLFRIRVVVPEGDGVQLVSTKIVDPQLVDALAPDALVQSDDPKIVEFSRDEIEGETNAWRAARRLEKAVRDHISKKNMGVGFASASETFESCEGDCSEHAVLLAACCRAVGIPSRIALGLVYAPLGDDNGIFGGHAWTEVSIDGAWYALDATLGMGHADPTHIRMSSSELKGGSFQGAFAGMLENLGNLELEIVHQVR